jgi:DNA-binding CsgD family transcriptional regulator
LKKPEEQTGLAQLATDAVTGDATWHDFLEHARRLMPNGRAFLFFHDAASAAGALSLTSQTADDMPSDYEAHYAAINPWMPHAAIRPLGKVVQADEMLPRDQLVRTEFYNEFLHPREIQTGFGATIVRDGSCNFMFSLLGAAVDDEEAAVVQRTLQSTVPQLRMAFEHYRNQPGLPTEALGGTGVHAPRGLVRLGPGARVLAADEQAIRLSTQTNWLSLESFGSFKTVSQGLMEHIAAVLVSWFRNDPVPAMRVFHVPRDEGRLPLRITVYGSGGTHVSYFRGPECRLVIEDPSMGLSEAAAEFAGFFGLSLAEQGVVEGIAAGYSPEAVAKLNGTSIHTVRSQLKQIFAKTGLGRQAEIASHVAMMAGGRRIS